MNDRFEGVQIDVDHSFFNHQQQNSQGVADVVAARAATNPSSFAFRGRRVRRRSSTTSVS